MASAISQVQTGHKFCALIPKFGSNSCPIVSLKVEKQQKGRTVLRCCKGDSVSETEKVLMEKELLSIEEEEELIGMRKLNENCREIGGGLVELLECLEREAIMGGDEGRDPTDYNRRALIFEKSSRVFQALKQTRP